MAALRLRLRLWSAARLLLAVVQPAGARVLHVPCAAGALPLCADGSGATSVAFVLADCCPQLSLLRRLACRLRAALRVGRAGARQARALSIACRRRH